MLTDAEALRCKRDRGNVGERETKSRKTRDLEESTRDDSMVSSRELRELMDMRIRDDQANASIDNTASEPSNGFPPTPESIQNDDEVPQSQASPENHVSAIPLSTRFWRTDPTQKLSKTRFLAHSSPSIEAAHGNPAGRPLSEAEISHNGVSGTSRLAQIPLMSPPTHHDAEHISTSGAGPGPSTISTSMSESRHPSSCTGIGSRMSVDSSGQTLQCKLSGL